jgi:N utilization substance protein B
MENNERYSRSAQREHIVQALYQVFLFEENQDPVDATAVIVKEYHVQGFEEVPAFSRVVYTLALDHLSEIEALVQSKLKNWLFSRLDNVCKAIFAEAVAEGNYADLAPKGVIINSAVQLSKSYLKEGDYKFVNAVLDKVLLSDAEKAKREEGKDGRDGK